MHDRIPVMDARQLAQAACQAMYQRDPATQGMGMHLIEAAPGFAVLEMVVRPDMLNGHGSCHGGYIFSLADSAFAFACNSHNINTVGAGCSIEYLSPARLDDLLTAEAVERELGRKTGIYDVTVRNQRGATVALFRGKSHRIGGEVVQLEFL
jgi:acyl-CoA thioesterase